MEWHRNPPWMASKEDKLRATSSERQAQSDKPRATSKEQQAKSNKQRATSKEDKTKTTIQQIQQPHPKQPANLPKATPKETPTMRHQTAVLTLALTLTACSTDKVSSKHRLLIMGSYRTVTCYEGKPECNYWNAGALISIRRDAAPFAAPHYTLRPS